MTTRHYVPLSSSPDWAAGVVANRKLMLGEQRRSMGNASFRNDVGAGKVWVDGEKDPLFKGLHNGEVVVIYKASSRRSSGLEYYGINFINNVVNWFSSFYFETEKGVTHLSGYMGSQLPITVRANNEIVNAPVVDGYYSNGYYSNLCAFYANSGELLWVYRVSALINDDPIYYIKIIRTNGEVIYTKSLPRYGFQSVWNAVNFKGSRLVTFDYLKFTDSIMEIYWDYNIDDEGEVTYNFGSRVFNPSYIPLNESAGPHVGAYDVLDEDPDTVVTTSVGDLGYDPASSIYDARYSTGGYQYGGYDSIAFDLRVKFYMAHGSTVQFIDGIWVWNADASVYLNGVKVYGGIKYVSEPLGAYNHRVGLAVLYFPDENVVKICDPSVKVWDDQKQEYGYKWSTVFEGKLTNIIPMPSIKRSNIM